jgi:ribosomal-protein-alanine N-acetyltransferase
MGIIFAGRMRRLGRGADEGMNYLDPGTGLTIRAMALGDLDRVVAIASSLQTAPHWGRSAYEDAIASGNEPRRIALVAERSGEVIGFAVVRVVPPSAEIETIAMEGRVQGFGFGSSLLLAMLEELKLAGVSEVELEVRVSNERALRVYGRAGFVEVGRRRGYYADPVEDAVLMRREL